MKFMSAIYSVRTKPKTRAKFYCDISVGDQLRFSADISNRAHHRGRSYALDTIIENITRGETWGNTQNVFSNCVSKLDLGIVN